MRIPSIRGWRGSVCAIGLILTGTGVHAATCTWIVTTGNWSSGAAWSGCGGAPPGAADTAVINNGGVVTLDVPVSVQGLDFGVGELTGAQTLTVTGAFNWIGGNGRTRISGSGSAEQLILASGSVNSYTDNPPGNSPELIGRTLTNRGTLTYSGTSLLYLQDDARVVNEGIWSMGSNTRLANGAGTGSRRFSNLAGATFNKTGATASQIDVAFHNDGSVQVADGNLLLIAGGALNGSHVIGTGSVLVLNGGSFTAAGASSSGAGTLSVDGGSLQFTGPATLARLALNGGALQFDSAASIGRLTLATGVLSGSGTPTVTEGFDWIGGNSTNRISGSGSAEQLILASGSVNSYTDNPPGNNPELIGRTLINRGTLTHSGTNLLYLQNDARVVNEGIWNLGSNTRLANGAGTGSRRFSNLAGATLNKTGATASQIDVAFHNDGSVQVADGNLLLIAGGTLNGSHAIGTGSALVLNGGSFTAAGASSSGAGTLSVDGGSLQFTGPATLARLALNGGALQFDSAASIGRLTLATGVLSGSGTPTVTEGFDWIGGIGTNRISGSGSAEQLILASGSVNSYTDNPPGNSPELIGRTLINRGTLTYSGTSLLYLQNDARVVNEGIWNMGSNTHLANGAGTGSRRFSNLAGATFNKTGATASQIDVETTNAGTLAIAASASLVVTAFSQSAGSTTLGAGAALSQSAGTLQFNGGTLGGSGSVQGSVVNNGAQLRPGASPGTLTISGAYTQGSGGSLEIELAGSTPGSGHDRLVVTGAALLDGSLGVTLLGGYVPNPADSYAFLTHLSRTGIFPTVANAAAGSHYISYAASSTTLTASGSNGELNHGVCRRFGYEGTQVSIPVSRSGGLDGAQAGWIATPGTAGAGDYTPGSGSVLFAPGSNAGSYTLQLLADDESEPFEQFSLALTDPSPGVSFGPRNVLVRILDGEGLFLDGFEDHCAPGQ